MTLILNPDPVLKAKWGPLAHVDEQERNRILGLPFGCFKPAVAQIEKSLKEIAKESEFKRIHRMPVNA